MQSNLYGMGRDPALFRDPELYQPERWLRHDAAAGENNLTMQALTNLAWGHGARMCLGEETSFQTNQTEKVLCVNQREGRVCSL